MLTQTERDWLAYARAVVGDDQHKQRCADLGGSPLHPGVDDPKSRWPGYLGTTAERGSCLLAVGNVHRNFASGRITAQLRDQLVTATQAWTTGHLEDEAYLKAVRTVYSAGLTGWTVGKHIRFAVSAFGLGVDSVAYTNAARCQFPEVPPKISRAGATKVALQRLCLARFPLGQLVDLLMPKAVLFSSSTAFDLSVDTNTGLVGGRPAVCFHQLNGTLLRPLVVSGVTLPLKVARSVWAPALAAAVNQGLTDPSHNPSGSC